MSELLRNPGKGTYGVEIQKISQGAGLGLVPGPLLEARLGNQSVFICP